MHVLIEILDQWDVAAKPAQMNVPFSPSLIEALTSLGRLFVWDNIYYSRIVLDIKQKKLVSFIDEGLLIKLSQEKK